MNGPNLSNRDYNIDKEVNDSDILQNIGGKDENVHPLLK